MQHIAHEGDLYDDVITTQSSEGDFSDIAHAGSQNSGKFDHSNGLGSSGSLSSNNYGGKRVSLYVGQLTWVCNKHHLNIVSIFFVCVYSGQLILI
jgi:hypothetical protein